MHRVYRFKPDSSGLDPRISITGMRREISGMTTEYGTLLQTNRTLPPCAPDHFRQGATHYMPS